MSTPNEEVEIGGRYSVFQWLGKGATADVYSGRNFENGADVAMKTYNLDGFFSVEAEITSKLRHPNVISVYDAIPAASVISSLGRTSTTDVLVMELARYGDLYSLVSQVPALPSPVVRYLVSRLLDGLRYIHAQGISHRDIKANNILVGEFFEPKLSDFGFSSQSFDGTMMVALTCGAESNRAPEAYLRDQYNGAAADVFSMGVILFWLYTGCAPFQKATSDDRDYYYIYAKEMQSYFERISSFTGRRLGRKFKDLITGMLAYNPDERMTIDQVLEHPFFNKKPLTNEKYVQFWNKTLNVNV